MLGFEADFGAGPVWRLASRVNPAQLPVVEQIFRALAPFKLVRGDNEARGGADLEGLSKLGMPIIEPGLDGTNYFDVHHTANDTLAQVDPQALRQSVAAFAVSVWLGAQYSGSWERVTTPSRRGAEPGRQPIIGDGGAGTGVSRRRCSACTCSSVRRVAAATEFKTGCVAVRGRLRPWVRSQARILASGALVVAVNSDSSARRRSSAWTCSSARRVRYSETNSPGIIGRMSFNACAPGYVCAAVCTLARRIDTTATNVRYRTPAWTLCRGVTEPFAGFAGLQQQLGGRLRGRARLRTAAGGIPWRPACPHKAPACDA